MTLNRTTGIGLAILVLALGGAGVFGWMNRETLRSWWERKPAAAEAPHAAQSAPNRTVTLTPQGRKNLGLSNPEELKLQAEAWRTIEIPGVIEDRPGISDRGVVAPVTGVVTRVHSFPGDTVSAGAVLFTMRLVSESLHTSQMELFKATREIQISKEEVERLKPSAAEGGIARSRTIELQNQIKRFEVVLQAYRQDLQTRGLTPAQIDQVAMGKFVVDVEVRAPLKRATPDGESEIPLTTGGDEPDDAFRFEVQELKVELGQQVQTGQTMCLLADHAMLFIEGKCFQTELPLIQQATKEGWKLKVEMIEDGIKPATESTLKWENVPTEFRIQHVANSVDPIGRTLEFFVPLTNQSKSYTRNGKKLLLWRYRPGQRVRFFIQVEKFKNVFVLPPAAVVREGPDSFVFNQNGENFDRLPVHVLFQDRNQVIVDNDGSIEEDMFIAQLGAVQLNRVLKSKSGDQPKGHFHADGTFHATGTPEPK